jgi:hypothetical protein
MNLAGIIDLLLRIDETIKTDWLRHPEMRPRADGRLRRE